MWVQKTPRFSTIWPIMDPADIYVEEDMLFEEDMFFEVELQEKIDVIHGFWVSSCKPPTLTHESEAVNLPCHVVSNSPLASCITLCVESTLNEEMCVRQKISTFIKPGVCLFVSNHSPIPPSLHPHSTINSQCKAPH